MKKNVRLPKGEVLFLSSLDQQSASNRALSLWEAGWSLGTIAISLNPPRPKSTIHFWVKKASKQNFDIPTPKPPVKLSIVKTRLSPLDVPLELKPRLKDLSELSRRYRAKTAYNSEFAIANRELSEISKNLYNQGVPAIAIAKAAGVTYRAMARRIKNA